MNWPEAIAAAVEDIAVGGFLSVFGYSIARALSGGWGRKND